MRVMYDSVTTGEIPVAADAVALYCDGHFANLDQRHRFHRKTIIVPITVWGSKAGRMADCEPGNMNAAQTAAWCRDELRGHPHRKPIAYGSRDETVDAHGTYGIPAILRELSKLGIHRDQVLIGSAHYSQGAHICSPRSCGASFTANGTQWTDKALNRNLDEWLLDDTFLDQAGFAAHQKRVHVPRPHKPKPPHPKTVAAGGAGALLTAIIAVLHATGIHHLTPAESAAAAALASLIAAAIAPKTRSG